MTSVRFALQIPPHQFLDYYRGAARVVRVTGYDGKTIQFPASALQKFVTKDGIYGDFELEFDEENRFVRLVNLSNIYHSLD